MRGQQAWGRLDLAAAVAEDDPARSIWAVVERLELSARYVPVAARDEVAGAPAIDPTLPLALWIYPASDGEGSAREIPRLAEVPASYRWLRGGVRLGYRTLSDVRSRRGADFDALLTQVRALLMQQGLVGLHCVAQDGTRVRASAGASAFRRTETPTALMQEARTHLDAGTHAAADPEINARRGAATRAAAADRLARLEDARVQVPEVTATFIVGVATINRGSDLGPRTPMLAQIVARAGVCPTELLVDGGYPQHDAIDEAAAQHVTVLAPVPRPRAGAPRDPHVARDGDSDAVAAGASAWAPTTPSSATSSAPPPPRPPNADATTHRGLDHLPVRGLAKALGCATRFALTYDILRLIALRGATARPTAAPADPRRRCARHRRRPRGQRHRVAWRRARCAWAGTPRRRQRRCRRPAPPRPPSSARIRASAVGRRYRLGR